MGPFKMVSAMSESPGVCMFCYGNPPGDDGNPMPCITAEGVDYDWGETPYICQECASVIADLIDRVDDAEFKSVDEELTHTRIQLEELKAEHEALVERVKQMLAGNKAKAETRAQLKTGKEKSVSG